MMEFHIPITQLKQSLTKRQVFIFSTFPTIPPSQWVILKQKITDITSFYSWIYQQAHSLFFFFFNFFCHMAWEILVPWPGTEPTSPALEAQSLNHWTTGEVPAHNLWIAVPCYWEGRLSTVCRVDGERDPPVDWPLITFPLFPSNSALTQICMPSSTSHMLSPTQHLNLLSKFGLSIPMWFLMKAEFYSFYGSLKS